MGAVLLEVWYEHQYWSVCCYLPLFDKQKEKEEAKLLYYKAI